MADTVKSLVILGSSGSIGESTLRVVAEHPDRFRVAGLAVNRATARVLAQARRFGVRRIAIADPQAAATARRDLPPGVELLAGDAGVGDLAATTSADVLVCAMVGMAGLKPVMAAIDAGMDVALATKEVLVAAGAQVMRARAARGVRIIPVDSEHSAIFQTLQSAAFAPACVRAADAPAASQAEQRIRRLILTASGGPFALRPEVDFERVTVEEALCHPRWSMGRKITIDSATMMNKGLEIIEACWLFNVPPEKIDVVVHPESIIHSLVEFVDGATLAQLSPPDMRLAIQYALTWPDRVPDRLPSLDLVGQGSLTFTAPDAARFPCLGLARHAMALGGTAPAVLNGANEVAVAAFLARHMTLAGIWRCVERVLENHTRMENPTLDEIIESDREARRAAVEYIAKVSSP